MRGLQQQCRFPDSGVASNQHQRAGNDPAAKHAVKLTDARQNTRLLVTFYIYDRLRLFFTLKNRCIHALCFDDAFRFLYHRVPFLAARALPEPFR